MPSVVEVLGKWQTASPLQRLQILSFVLAEVDERLAGVLQGVGTNPDAPTTAVLMQIKGTAQTIVTRVDQKLPPPLPTPPPDLPP